MQEYLKRANQETYLIVQVEDQQGVNRAESILNVEGVSFLMLGPGDFSILSGFPGDIDHPKVQAAIDTVAAAAGNTGKHWAATAGSAERAAALVQAGCDLVFHQADILLIRDGFEATRSRLTEAGLALRPPLSGADRGARE